jgi:hypothetical protein
MYRYRGKPSNPEDEFRLRVVHPTEAFQHEVSAQRDGDHELLPITRRGRSHRRGSGGLTSDGPGVSPETVVRPCPAKAPLGAQDLVGLPTMAKGDCWTSPTGATTSALARRSRRRRAHTLPPPKWA